MLELINQKQFFLGHKYHMQSKDLSTDLKKHFSEFRDKLKSLGFASGEILLPDHLRPVFLESTRQLVGIIRQLTSVFECRGWIPEESEANNSSNNNNKVSRGNNNKRYIMNEAHNNYFASSSNIGSVLQNATQNTLLIGLTGYPHDIEFLGKATQLLADPLGKVQIYQHQLLAEVGRLGRLLLGQILSLTQGADIQNKKTAYSADQWVFAVQAILENAQEIYSFVVESLLPNVEELKDWGAFDDFVLGNQLHLGGVEEVLNNLVLAFGIFLAELEFMLAALALQYDVGQKIDLKMTIPRVILEISSCVSHLLLIFA